ncbi:MAG: hypothetical protein LBI04_04300 [Treponema sp.]|jgi:hypothetical protein|nr:hypothetical protein [Treponema sp.]
MSKQHDSGAAPLALERAVERWDYDKSVIKMKELSLQWQKATAGVARELFLARGHLKKCQHHDPSASNYSEYTWKIYCEEIGLSCEIANYWIKKFIPREISGTGKDVLLIKAPVKEEAVADRAIMESRIIETLRTGKRPIDWTDKEEAELKRRKENARFSKLAEELNMPAVARTKTDYFANILKHSKDIVNFKLADRNQILAQAAIFDHIETYLKTFNDPETKAQAAFNLALKTRNYANEIAEMNIQLSESLPEKDEGHGS